MVTSFSLAVMAHNRSTTIMPASAPAAPASPTVPAPGQK
jgi:hypothetical protein